MKGRRLPIAVVGLALLAAACSAAEIGADGDISDPFTRVVVASESGDIQILRATGAVSWEARAAYSGSEPDIEPTVVDGELIVDAGCAGRDDCTVEYFLSVPEDTEVVVRTRSGDVTVTEISAAVTVETESGIVFLNTVKGEIEVTTGSGDIIGTKLEAFSAHFTSNTGRIDIAFEAIITDLTAETGTGDVTAQLAGGPYNLDAETGSGKTDIKVADDDTAPYSAYLRTLSGDLTVYEQ